MIGSILIPSSKQARLKTESTIKGEIPSPINLSTGCRFHMRCSEKTDICHKEAPRLKQIGDKSDLKGNEVMLNISMKSRDKENTNTKDNCSTVVEFNVKYKSFVSGFYSRLVFRNNIELGVQLKM